MILGAEGEIGESGLALLDGLPGVSDVGLSGIVVFVIYLILTGRLIPKRHLDDSRSDNKVLRETNEKYMQTLIELTGATRETLELAKSADHLLREIQSHNGAASREATS